MHYLFLLAFHCDDQTMQSPVLVLRMLKNDNFSVVKLSDLPKKNYVDDNLE